MRDYFEQVRSSLDKKLYYLALMGSLVIPDMCAAIDSNDGKTDCQKYKKCFKKYYPKKYRVGDFEVDSRITANDYYKLRCSVLHEGSSRTESKGFSTNPPFNLQNPSVKYSKFIFTGKESNMGENVIGNDKNKESVLNINIYWFCNNLILGGGEWIRNNEITNNYKKNYGKFLKSHPLGMDGYIEGIPVFGND